jgi:hypothetical protein
VGAADAVEQATPYYAWRPIVSRLLGLEALGAAPPETRRAHVLAQLQDDPALVRLAPLLSDVVAVDLPDTELTGAMTGDVRADNTRELVVGLLQRTGGGPQPHVLILEDAHWLDSASWPLARQVVAQVAPLLLVLATRPLSEPQPLAYQRLHDAPATRVLRLTALEADETATLVGRRLGAAVLPEPVARLIVERAEGNPFYSEELGLALRDAGVITVAEGVCRLAPTAGDLRGLALPDTVQGVITSRIDRLPPREQLTLKVASVIGRVFAHRMLRDVHPVEGDRQHLAAALQVLERQELTVQEMPEPDLAYLFKHVITQETAYSLMPFAQRRELHRAVAGWIERREGSDLASYYPLLAYHWGRAEDRAKTLDYLELAGEQALHQSAYEEAVGYFTEALRLDAASEQAEDSLRRARWERQLGEAHVGLGHLAESRAHLEHALALLGRPVPATRVGLVASLAGQGLRQALHRIAHGRWPGRWQPLSAVELEAARAEGRLLEVLMFGYEMLPAVHSTVRNLNRVEAAAPSPELAWAYANACAGASFVPLHSLADTYSRLGLEAARRVADLPALCWVLMMTGLQQAGVGQWARAEASAQEALDIAERLGDWRHAEQCRALLWFAVFYGGELARAAQLGTDIRASARRRGDTQMEVAGLLVTTMYALAADTPDRAVELAEENAALARGAPRAEHFGTKGLLALARMHRGEPLLALQTADEAAQLIARDAPMPVMTRMGYEAVAEVYLTHWEAGHRAAARPARQACAAFRAYARAYPIGEAPFARCQGLAEWLDGRPSRARRAWQKSLAAAERLAMPLDEGRAHYELGRHLPAEDPARREHLERACALFEQMGATYYLAHAAEALERSAESGTG